MVALHEALAVAIAEIGAFAAQGLGEQKARHAGHVERGGMELDELEVGDFGAGAVGGRDAVAGGDVGIGGLEEDAAEAAGGEQDGARVNGDGPLDVLLIDVGAEAAAVGVDEQIGHAGEAAELDIRQAGGVAVEGFGDLAAGGIAVGVENAVARMSAFAAEHELAVFAVEFSAPLEELFDDVGAFGDEGADGLLVAEAVASHEGVADVEVEAVVLGHGGGDAALGVLRRGLAELILGEEQNASGGGELNGGTETGDAGADDQEVDMDRRHSVG